MANDKKSNRKQFTKRALLKNLEDQQREALIDIILALDENKNINKRDIKKIFDYSKMTSGDICDLAKLNRKTLLDICTKDQNIKNSDGSYSLTNLIDYFRSKGSGTVGSIEEKRKVETDILNKKLEALEERYILKEEVEKMLCERLENMFTYFTKEINVDTYKYANKTADEVKVLLEDMIRNALKSYRGTDEVIQ